MTFSSKQIQAGLEEYKGEWSTQQITHLLKRVMFGAKPSDVNYFKTKTLSQSVEELLKPQYSQSLRSTITIRPITQIQQVLHWEQLGHLPLMEMVHSMEKGEIATKLGGCNKCFIKDEVSMRK
jgi:hypothetical protein